MTKKKVKLAIIRRDDADVCPFGLSIPTACKIAGSVVDRMAPLDALGPNATDEEKEKVTEANKRLLRWSVMQSEEPPTTCKYVSNLFPQKKAVDCNWGDTAAGQTGKGALLGSPFYSKVFNDYALTGAYSIPIGYYADNNISRNTYYGAYSLQGHVSDNLLSKLAQETIDKFIKVASITFVSDADVPTLTEMSPCLCTQDSDKFVQWHEYGVGPKEEMREAANPDCVVCKGTGVESFERDLGPSLNMSNSNAYALLAVLGLPLEPNGEISIPEARRALMKARSRSSFNQFTREPESGNRFWDAGFGTDDIEERLDRFENIINHAVEHGGKNIRWG